MIAVLGTWWKQPGQVAHPVQQALEFHVPWMEPEEDQVTVKWRRQAKGAHAGVAAKAHLMSQ